MSSTTKLVINTDVATDDLIASITSNLDLILIAKHPKLKYTIEAYSLPHMPNTLVTIQGLELFSVEDWMIELADG